ncbi:MAG: carboxypeptidase-like regulatory domain-containing protein, partial [Terriglobia bacterium]
MFNCSHKSFWTYLVGVTCSLFLGAVTLLGQGTSGTITGTVTDPSGAVVPDATVVVLGQGTGVEFHLTSNRAGVYSITSLIPGKYTVTVSAKGFKTYANRDLEMTINQVLRVDVALEVGAETQTITVEAAVP